MAGRGWRGRTSGANIPNVRVYVCDACGAWVGASKPAQCQACGNLAFTHFHSKAEARRFGELKLELGQGLIEDLKLQSVFVLHAFRIPDGDVSKMVGTKIGKYLSDFEYTRNGERIVEDVKGGADTDLSAWKRKHAEAEHGVKITAVRR